MTMAGNRRVLPGNFYIEHAERQWEGDSRNSGSVFYSTVRKNKSLNKFGLTEEAGTTNRTLALLGSGEEHETYVSANSITHIASDSSDTTTYALEYHTIDGSGNFTFGVQTGTLAGTTKTALATPCARVSRLYNTSGTAWAGNIYVAEDVTFSGGVPQTASAIHLVVPAGYNQSLKAATTISNNDVWFISQIKASVNKKTAATVDLFLEIREKGGVFRKIELFTLASTGLNSLVVPFEPHILVPPNSDVRLTTTASTGGVSVSGSMNGVLALSENA